MYEKVLHLLRVSPTLNNAQVAEALSCEPSQKLSITIKDARKRIDFENIDSNCTDIVLMAAILKLGIIRPEDIIEKFKEKGREKNLKQIVFIKQQVNFLELKHTIAQMDKEIERIYNVFGEMASIFTEVEDVDFASDYSI